MGANVEKRWGIFSCASLVFPLTILVWWILVGHGNSAGIEGEEIEDDILTSPPLIMQKLHLEEFQGEGKTVDLWAASAELFREEERVQIQDVRIFLHIEEDNTYRKVELVGREGSYNLAASVAMIRGDVRISTLDGHTLNTDKIRYNLKKDLISGPGIVHVEGPEGWTKGLGFQMDTKNETVILFDRVQTLIRPNAVEKAREILPK